MRLPTQAELQALDDNTLIRLFNALYDILKARGRIPSVAEIARERLAEHRARMRREKN